VTSTILYQMGNFSETLSNLGMFKQIEEDLVDLIKCSLVDNGKKVENDFNLGYFKGLYRNDSDPEIEPMNE